jgi:hypothetical protein
MIKFRFGLEPARGRAPAETEIRGMMNSTAASTTRRTAFIESHANRILWNDFQHLSRPAKGFLRPHGVAWIILPCHWRRASR